MKRKLPKPVNVGPKLDAALEKRGLVLPVIGGDTPRRERRRRNKVLQRMGASQAKDLLGLRYAQEGEY